MTTEAQKSASDWLSDTTIQEIADQYGNIADAVPAIADEAAVYCVRVKRADIALCLTKMAAERLAGTLEKIQTAGHRDPDTLQSLILQAEEDIAFLDGSGHPAVSRPAGSSQPPVQR